MVATSVPTIGAGNVMLCLATTGAVVALSASSFTLSWTHSVEKTQWQERWQVESDRLVLVEASVEGPGAGIAVPSDAHLEGGRWTYRPDLPPLPELILAASGMTPSPWQLCLPDGTCRALGSQSSEATRIWTSAACEEK